SGTEGVIRTGGRGRTCRPARSNGLPHSRRAYPPLSGSSGPDRSSASPLLHVSSRLLPGRSLFGDDRVHIRSALFLVHGTAPTKALPLMFRSREAVADSGHATANSTSIRSASLLRTRGVRTENNIRR